MDRPTDAAVDSVDPLLLYWVGMLIGTLAALACLGGMLQLGLARTFGRQAGSVMHSGMYRFSRNPQVLFAILALSGVGLASLSWNGLIFALQFAGVAHVMVLVEEEHLGRAHGADYAAYRARTPRYAGITFFRRGSTSPGPGV